MHWEFSNDAPIYTQLMDQLKAAIVSGVWQPGERLPSVRDLAMEAKVNPNTMQRALTELERDGLVFSQRTAGRYVSEDAALIEATKADLARVHIVRCKEALERLGYTEDEVLALLASSIGKE